MECTGPELECGAYRLDEVDLDVQAYQLHCYDPESSQQVEVAHEKAGDDSPQASTITLPNRELDGVWESYAQLSPLGVSKLTFRLLFDTPIPSNLLRAVSRMSARLLHDVDLHFG